MKKTIAVTLILTLIMSIVAPLFAFAEEDLSHIDIPWEDYFENIETNLEEMENVHPRIWLTNDDFARIKGYAQNEYNSLWKLIVKNANSYVNSGPVVNFYVSGENTWMNTQGKKLVHLIFTYKISGDTKYLDAVKNFIDAICEYPSWSNSATGDNCHLAGQSNFLAFGLAYDWLYDELGDDENGKSRREKIAENIASRIVDFNTDNDYGFDKINCHNMLIINTSAFVALGAMYDKIPRAEEYMKRISAKIATLTMEVMPDDGAAWEAVNYSSYTWLGLLQAGLVMRELLNIDIINHPTFDAYTKFSCYSYIPVNAVNDANYDIFGWADGTEQSAGNLLPVMSFMAKEKQNPVYKYFVEKRLELSYTRNNGGSYPFIFALMFADPDLESKSPEEYKDNKNGNIHFPYDYVTSDTGYVFLRNGWSGDETAIAFHAGPIMGNTAREFREIYEGSTLGVGHNHPDMGSPIIIADGQWLFQDDNYVSRYTRNHSTLAFHVKDKNGNDKIIGQVSDDSLRNVVTDYIHPGTGEYMTAWQAMTYANPQIVKFEEYDDMTYVVCDLTDIYPDEHYGEKDVHLNKYYRHFLYLKAKKALLVVDDVQTDTDSEFEIRWRPNNSMTFTTEEDGSYLYTKNTVKMRLEAFNTEGLTIENSKVNVSSDKDGNTAKEYVVQLKNQGKKWLQPTAISWEKVSIGAPLNFEYTENGGLCSFNIDGEYIHIDTVSNKILTGGKIYYYNDFTKDDPVAFNKAESTNVGFTDIENGVFNYTYGTYKLNNATTSVVTGTANVKTNCYVKVNNDENGQKPDVCLEYKVKINGLTANWFSGSYRLFYGYNSYGNNSVVFTKTKILADHNKTEAKYGQPILQSSDFNGTEHVVKVYYSATRNIRTVYIDGVCYGTFDNTLTSDRAWANNTNGQFHYAFQLNKSGNDAVELDYVKVSKAENMVSVKVENESGNVDMAGSATSDLLWIPEGEQVNLNLFTTDKKECTVKFNGETYIDSFKGNFAFKTPALKEGDSITIETGNIETEVASYTSPYTYQYEREDGAKSAVVLGRFSDGITGYVPYSYGIYFSLKDSNVTIGNEDVYKLDISMEENNVVYGNYAIELYSEKLKENDIIYFKSYVEYKTEESEELVSRFGNVQSIKIK